MLLHALILLIFKKNSLGQQGVGGAVEMGYPTETKVKRESNEISYAHKSFFSFEIVFELHALYKSPKRLGNWNGYYGRKIFREI